jgi:hypothetical protein
MPNGRCSPLTLRSKRDLEFVDLKQVNIKKTVFETLCGTVWQTVANVSGETTGTI